MVKFYNYLGNPVLPRLIKVTPAVYPHLNDFSVKVDTLNLEFQIQAKNIPVGLPSSPIKIWGKLVQGFLSYDRTNKQTDRQTEITTLYIYS